MTTANSVEIDEKKRTVTIRQEGYSLKQGSYHKDYHHVVYAATVEVKKGFVNPGRDLTIYASRLVVDREGGKIDVSGADGVYKEGRSRDATTVKQGTYDGSDGLNGDDGEAGQNGGNITIHAARITGGPLELISKGGAGARAQDGGNGRKGEQPEERGRPKRPETVVVDRKWVETGTGRGAWSNVYGWGSDVKKIGELSATGAYLLVTPGAAVGANGGNGGNAGLVGKPGNGGTGGKVVVRTLLKSEASIIAKELGGGNAGASGKHGSPGDGATAGLGAKYLYKADAASTPIDWSTYDEKGEWDKVWNTKNSKAVLFFDVDHFKNLDVNNDYIEKDGDYKKLKLRAASGQNGKKGGYGAAGESKAPPIPTASPGVKGSFVTEKVDATGKAFRDVPFSYLLMLQRSAAAAMLNRDTDEAADILRWLMVLTSDYKDTPRGATPEPKYREQIYYQSEQALLTRDRDSKELAPRCGYTDIERYADFVEASLKHIEELEKSFNRYSKEKQTLAERKKALDDAIAEAREYVVHLTGNASTPGSIEYCREKETQLKTAVSRLDIDIKRYGDRLEQMPQTLQEAIDAKVREKQQLTCWQVLDFISMAAGIALNFAGAAGGIKAMVDKVKDFYKEALELSTWGEILKEGIWNREFTQIKGDMSALLETEEWKKASGSTKKFIGGVADFWGKIEAYDEIAKSRKHVEYKLDLLDVQATVLIFDTAKLELKKQRNEFKKFIAKFIEEYSEARDWKHVFADFFDTSETRFDLLGHLADLRAELRELEYQRGVYERNVALLIEQKNKLEAQPGDFQEDDVRTSLEANLQIALDQGLSRVVDEARAYRIWTLQNYAFPTVPKNLTADILRKKFHEPLWTKIKVDMSKWKTSAGKDFSSTPFVWRRDENRMLFSDFAVTGEIKLALPIDETSNIYFERLTDAKVFVRGAVAKRGSAFYCQLRHLGISDFIDHDRKTVTCYQEPRAIEFSYVVEGDGSAAQPSYDYKDAIKQSFDVRDDAARIRYSPYTVWEIRVPKNYKLNARSAVYNEDLNLAQTTAIELRCDILFDSISKPRLKRMALKESAAPRAKGAAPQAKPSAAVEKSAKK